MRNVLCAATFASLLCSFPLLANYQWLGEADGLFSNTNNWEEGRIPSFDQTQKELTIISNGERSALSITEGVANGASTEPLTLFRLYLMYSAGIAGSVVQTGGNVALTDGNAAALTIGYASAVSGNADQWNIYTLSGGSIACTSEGGGLIIGNWSKGRLVQSGGTISLQGPLQMGMNENEGAV